MTPTDQPIAPAPTPAEDPTFPLHALFAYGASLLLIVFLGSRFQRYDLRLGLLFTEIACIALPAAIVLRIHRKAAAPKMLSLPTPRKTALTIGIGLCAAVIAVYKGIVTRKALFGIDTSGVDASAGISLLLLAVLAPLCEELLFRPVIQNGLAHHWSNRNAVLVTALLFALFHLQIQRFAETFLIGIFAGIAFLKTRNLWYPLIVHGVCNALGPLLWRSAPHLAFLFNPLSAIALGCLAIAACYRLGERSPAPLKGLRRHLQWAAFGTPHSFPTAPRPSRAVAPLAGTIILSLMILLGYSHAIMLHHMANGKAKSKYLVSEKDEWTIAAAGEVQARSHLAIRKSPETCEDLILQLPFPDAALNEVKLRDTPLPFSRQAAGEYKVNLSSPPNAVPTATAPSIIVLWTFPLDRLTPANPGYRIPLKPLVPSDSFSLAVTIAPASPFRFIDPGAAPTQPLFKGESAHPLTNFGNCSLLIERQPHRP